MKPGLLMLPSAVSDSHVHNILPNKIDTDFQFSRASAATRVNHQGLIENVGYFSDELVRNGNFSELGPELVTNGNFATDSDWTATTTDWTISNGKAIYQGSSNANLKQNGILVSGKTHKLIYEVISNTCDGSLKLMGETVSGGLNISETVGVQTVYFVANGTQPTNFGFRVTGATTGILEISNVSVKQVDPDDDWILGGQAWSITDKLNADGTQTTGTNSYQSQTFDNGKTYKVVFTCTIQAGNLDVRLQGGGSTVVGTTHTTSGTFTQLLTSTGNTSLRFRGNSNFIGSISSVSVVEVLGDKPRLDYDPSNLTCPHLLLEPQSTNLVTFSEDFTQNYWAKNNCTVTPNAIISPTGEVNASLIQETVYTTSSSSIDLLNAISLSAGTYTLSFYVKNNKGRYLGISFGSGSERVRTNFDFDTNTFKALNFTGTTTGSASFTTLGDFYRLSITATFPSTVPVKNTIMPLATDTYPFFANQDSDNRSFYMWGVQWDAHAYSTSYIPTAGSQETRVQETCTNAGNINTFNDAEGVLYTEVAVNQIGLTNGNIFISDGTTSNFIMLRFAPTHKFQVEATGGVNIIENNARASGKYKVAVKYSSAGVEMWIDGNKEKFTSTAPTGTGINQLGVGSSPYGNIAGCEISSAATYNRALTDTELYTITSTQYSAYSGMVAALGNYTIPC